MASRKSTSKQISFHAPIIVGLTKSVTNASVFRIDQSTKLIELTLDVIRMQALAGYYTSCTLDLGIRSPNAIDPLTRLRGGQGNIASTAEWCVE